MASELPPSGTPPAEDRALRPGPSGDVRAPSSLRGSAKPLLRRFLSVVALVAIDLTALVFSLLIALVIKQGVRLGGVDLGVAWSLERHNFLAIASLTMLLVFARFGLYAPRETRPGAARILSGVTATTLILFAFAVITGVQFDTYYLFYSSWFLMCLLALTLRASYESITALALDRAHFQRRALLVGEPELAEPIAAALTANQHPRRGVAYRVVAVHPPASDLLSESPSPEGLALRHALDSETIDEVIVTGGLATAQSLRDLLLLCRRDGIPVRLAPTTAELVSYSLRPSATPGLPLFELRSPTLGWVQFQVKRAFDLVVGSLLLLLAAPLLGAAALAIRIEDRGSAFYRARRIGLNQRPFTCLKLRTMRVGADAQQAALEGANQADGPLFKIREDPRVTRVGSVLRRFSIDELPQLWNVLRGEMSLVGPRPLPERDFNQMDDVAKRRYVVLPGLTGLWQVSGRSDLSGDELVRLDMQYIEGWSLWTDIVILARTLPVVIFGKGAY